MSVYLEKRKHRKERWRYDFTKNGIRYAGAGYKTKRDALQAEARRKEEISNPKQETMSKTQTDMDFLGLVNKKMDHVKAYNSECHYRDFFYNARRWIRHWGNLKCREISKEMVQEFILERSKKSACTANQDLRYLRSVFNYGKKRELIDVNPTQGLEFLPVEKKIKYVPASQDIDKLIQVADPDTQNYLWVVRETLARVGEINRLIWNDVDLDNKIVVLYTRKKKGGNLTPRRVPMTDTLYEVLSKMYAVRDTTKPWVFWHTYKSRRTGKVVFGPYTDRKDIMSNLCEKAEVKYFRFHALRHAGASMMENNNVPIRAIQKILGHENISTTEIYLHSIGTAEREAISVYELARQRNSHADLQADA